VRLRTKSVCGAQRINPVVMGFLLLYVGFGSAFFVSSSAISVRRQFI